MLKRLIASFVCLTFSFSNFQYVYAQDFSINQLPVPGTMVGESAPFSPLALKGLVVNPLKPLEFQFIVDTGRGPQDTATVKEQANQLVKYFLAGLTIPEGDLWVNLSPYEKDRMVPEALGQTELGRDLLAQDYILKQLTASLIYPEKALGKEFWSRVYTKAQQQFGTTNVPVNTFNKVWILPDQAQVFENVNAAYVTKSTLKVMLDEDYLAKQKHMIVHNDIGSVGANIVREIVLPEIEKEVNTGKNFAPLRQIYQALILAKWYKETIQNGLLDAVYTNKNKVAGVNLNDPAVKEEIYQRYLKAYRKGVFNYIREDSSPDGQVMPRKYFSGGITKLEPDRINTDGAMSAVTSDGMMMRMDVDLEKPKDAAMMARARIAGWKLTDNVDKIAAMLSNGSEGVRQSAEKALAKLGASKERMVDAYIAVLSSGSIDARVNAVNELADLGVKRAVGPLTSLLNKAEKNKSYEEYNQISWQLNKMGSPEGRWQYVYHPSESTAQEWVFEKVKRSDAAMLQAPGAGEFNSYSIANDILTTSSNSGEVINPARIRRLGAALDLAHSFIEMQRDIPLEEINQKIRDLTVAKSSFVQALSYFLYSPLEREQVRAASLIYNMYLGSNNAFEKDSLRVLFKSASRIIDKLNGVQNTDADQAMFARAMITAWALTDNLDNIASMLNNGDEGVRKAAQAALIKLGATKERMIDAYTAVLSSSNYGVHLWAIHQLQSLGRTPRIIKAIADYQARVNKIRGTAMLSRTPLLVSMESVQEVKGMKTDEAMLGSLGADTTFIVIGLGAAITLSSQFRAKKRLKLIEALRNPDQTVTFNYIKNNFGRNAYGWLKQIKYTPDEPRLMAGLIKAMAEFSHGTDEVAETWSFMEELDYEHEDGFMRTATAWAQDRLVRKGSKDSAMLQAPSLAENGGIDLNQINVNRHGRTVNVQFDPAQLNQLMQDGFEGFTPVIISMTPISSPLLLLGIGPANISK